MPIPGTQFRQGNMQYRVKTWTLVPAGVPVANPASTTVYRQASHLSSCNLSFHFLSSPNVTKKKKYDSIDEHNLQLQCGMARSRVVNKIQLSYLVTSPFLIMYVFYYINYSLNASHFCCNSQLNHNNNSHLGSLSPYNINKCKT